VNPGNPYTFTSCTATCGINLNYLYARIGDMKKLTDGMVMRRYDYDGLMALDGDPPLPDPVVINCTSGFYVQEPDGSAGIRLMFDAGPPAVSIGQKLSFDGMLFTAQDERVLRVSTCAVSGAGPQVVHGMPVKSVGGGDYFWNCVMCSGQSGVAGESA